MHAWYVGGMEQVIALGRRHGSDRELSDEQLDQVSGGGNNGPVTSTLQS